MKKILLAIILLISIVFSCNIIVFAGNGTCKPNEAYCGNQCQKLIEYTTESYGELRSKQVYEYDEFGRYVTGYEYSTYDNGATWTLRGTSTFKYDVDGRVILEEIATSGAGRDGDNKTEYSYDDFGNMTSCIDYSYSTTTGDYVPSCKDTYTYNSNQKLTEHVFYNQFDVDWIPFLKEVKEYNNDGDLLVECQYQYYNNEWNPQGNRITYTYNDLHKAISVLSEWYNSYVPEYQFNKKEVNEYSTDGTLLSKELYSAQNATKPSSKIEYYTDATTYRETSTQYDSKGEIINKYYNEKKYDDHHNIISNESYKYNLPSSETSRFSNYSTVTYTYDGDKITKYEQKTYDISDKLIVEVIEVTTDTYFEHITNSYNDPEESFKVYAEYDEFYNVVKQTRYGWDTLDNDWIVNTVETMKFTTIHQTVLGEEKKGIKEYFECIHCHQYFEDEEGTKLIPDLNEWKDSSNGNGGFIVIIIIIIILLLLIIYLAGYFFLYRKGKLDDSGLKVIYCFLPKPDTEDKEEKQEEKQEENQEENQENKDQE